MGRILEKEGLALKMVSDEEEGIKSIEEKPPKMVIASLSGKETERENLLNAIKGNQKWNKCPIILVVGRELNSNEMAALGKNIKRVFHKGNFSKLDLLGEIKKYVNC